MKSNSSKKRVTGLVIAVVLSLVAIGGYVTWKNSEQKSFIATDQITDQTADMGAEGESAETEGQIDAAAGVEAGEVADHKAAAGTLDLAVDSDGLSKSTVVMNTTRGKIKFKFYSEDAPNTVRRMAELIQKGFYNGLTFHRVVPGFVIQGGDPDGNGTGGSGVKQKAEFNSRKHVPGTVAMARAQDPDSADSQFYISLGTHPHLDNQYTVFGFVTEGMDVAEQIQVGDRMTHVGIE